MTSAIMTDDAMSPDSALTYESSVQISSLVSRNSGLPEGGPVPNTASDGATSPPQGMTTNGNHRISTNEPTALAGAGLDPHSIFEPIDDPPGYPRLDYKPVILRRWALLCVLAFNAIILALLCVLIFVKDISFSSQWGYFSIKILPPVIGTITASLWLAITNTLSRISPYISSAKKPLTKEGQDQGKDPAHQTILAQYFPVPSIVDMMMNGDILPGSIWILMFLSSFLLPFKAVLLNTTSWIDYWDATVTVWALYPLIVIYSLLVVATISLIVCLSGIRTGLRWDPVSIADHLVLFHHSNFLAKFEGTDIASRQALHKRYRFGHLRLGYWDRGPLGYWHGFGRVGDHFPESAHHPNTNSPPAPRSGTSSVPAQSELEQIRDVDTHDLSQVCYRTAYLNMEYPAMLIWTTLAVGLLCLLIVAAAMGITSGRDVALPYGIAAFLFQWLPTLVVGFYAWFWEEADMFCRATQPFIGMREPRPAEENLLLNYASLPAGIVTYAAITNEHWKVARVSAMALLNRLLVIIFASMITVVRNDGYCTIYASLPLIVLSSAFIALYCGLIPFEVAGDGFNRHLPRNYLAIVDLISWCYGSSLLRNPDLDVSRPETGSRMGDRWHMESRLRLQGRLYRFGAYRSNLHPGKSCIGFDEIGNITPIDPPSRHSFIDRALHPGVRHGSAPDVEMAVMPGQPVNPVATEIEVVVSEEDKLEGHCGE